MGKHIALLRAVNLAGINKVGMAELRTLASDLGFSEVTSLLQSGNLVFEGSGKPAALGARFEKEAKKRLGLETDFFVRTATEWQAIVAGNPFSAEAKDDPGHLVVAVLKAAAGAKAVAALQAAARARGPEQIRAGGRHVYVTYPDGIGRSKLTAALMEKHLGCAGTARNWNTVLKLAAAAGV